MHDSTSEQRMRLGELDVITHEIIGAGMAVHRALGPGLLESAYEACMQHELHSKGLRVARQRPQPIRYSGVELECGFRLDLVVEEAVLVELKAVALVLPIHECQVLTYLRLSRLRVGLLLNFNVPVLAHGIRRFVDGKIAA